MPTSETVEVELKLEVARDGADALLGSGLLPGEPATARLEATYFDTPKRRLAKRGVSLRLRRSGDRIVQTVKVGDAGTAGLFARQEWEREVGGEQPMLDDSTPLAAVLGKRAAKLRPVFTIEVARRTWTLREGESDIEAVIDRGTARADGREAPISEVELELLGGSVAAVFALARRLDEAAPLRLGVLTKAERGWSLLEPPRAAYKAESVAFADDTTAAEAFRRICHSCVRQFRLNEDLLLANEGSEALHQARVAIRRLRSAFTGFKRLVAADPQTAKLASELRWLAAELGEVRNIDVLLAKAGPGAVHDRLQESRAGAYARVAGALDSARSRLLFLDLSEWLADGAWLRLEALAAARDQPAGDFASVILERLRRRIRKAGPALDGADDEPRHELRKDAKKLRYAAEFFSALFDAGKQKTRRKKFLTALEELQDALGVLNDMATGPEVLRQLAIDGDDAQALIDLSDREELLQAARTALDKLADVKRFWRTRKRTSLAGA